MFHGISINKKEVVLDGSEAPIKIDAEALLASERLAPSAILNKVKLVPYSRLFILFSFGVIYSNMVSFPFICCVCVMSYFTGESSISAY